MMLSFLLRLDRDSRHKKRTASPRVSPFFTHTSERELVKVVVAWLSRIMPDKMISTRDKHRAGGPGGILTLWG